MGHGGGGINTHAGGYKIDLRLNWCLNNFIEHGAKTNQNPTFDMSGIWSSVTQGGRENTLSQCIVRFRGHICGKNIIIGISFTRIIPSKISSEYLFTLSSDLFK